MECWAIQLLRQYSEALSIVLTTIHAQDFQDVPGDRIQGRKTFTDCSAYCEQDQHDLSPDVVDVAGSHFSDRRYPDFPDLRCNSSRRSFMLFRTVPADRISYVLYNVRCFPIYHVHF